MKPGTRRDGPLRRMSLGAAAVCVLALGGCKHRHMHDAGEAQRPSMLGQMAPQAASVAVSRFAGLSASRKRSGSDIAYDHALTMTVPAAQLAAHFAQLRDMCLGLAGCELISANLDTQESGPGEFARSARIAARLPHDKVESFLKAAGAPMAGERISDVVTSSANTSERDLHSSVTDVARRIAQLTAYRDRLETLEAQSAGRTDDLIKVAKELSESQSALEAAQQEKADLARQIDTEEVTVEFQSASEVISPLRKTVRQTRQLFMESLADLWVFLVQFVVWAPLTLLALLVLRGAWRRGWLSRS